MSIGGEAPQVSAVITAYNNADTIGPAIDSLLRQEFSRFEVIVVDDGSTDGTRKRVAGYGEAVRLIWQENGGSARARNTGICSARGEYVAFLDGDDVALPDRLRQQAAVLETRPEVGLVYGNICLMDSQGRNVRLRRGTGRYKSGRVTRELAVKNFVPFSTIMVRRQLLLEAGLFDESIRSSEDWDLLVRLSRHCEFLFLNRPLVHYRIVPSSKTANVAEKELAYKHVQRKIFAENHFGADTWRLRRLSDASLEFSLLSICLRYGKYAAGVKHLLRGLAISPGILFHLRREISSRLFSFILRASSTS